MKQAYTTTSEFVEDKFARMQNLSFQLPSLRMFRLPNGIERCCHCCWRFGCRPGCAISIQILYAMHGFISFLTSAFSQFHLDSRS